MYDESKLIRERERGENAKRLLKNELLVEAFDTIEEKLMAEWQSTGPDGMPHREDCWRTLMLLKKLKGVIEQHVKRGETSVKYIAALEEEKTRKRRFPGLKAV